MASDLRHAVRLLLKGPGFALVAVISLTLGIGANTAVFSLFHALFLKSLPGQNPQELVSIYTSDYSGPAYGTSSYADYLEMREKNEVLSGVICYAPFPATITIQDRTERIFGEFVSGNYFSVLGISPQIGRGFTHEEDKTPGTHPVTVLSDEFWRKQFHSDRSIIGKKIQLGGNPFIVVGVAPRGFSGMLRGFGSQFWVPTMSMPILQPSSNDLTSRGSRSWFLIGRLKPKVTLKQAQANFKVLGMQFFKTYPEQWTNVHRQPRQLSVLSESQSRIFPMISQPVLGFIALLTVIVGVVLLIACSNLTNLLLARSTFRRKEIAIRLSLGASRGRLIRQLLMESTLISVIAGAAGLLITFWARQGVSTLEPLIPIPVSIDAGINVPVLCFTFIASVFTGSLFGLAPALQSTRLDLAGIIKDETTFSFRKSRLRNYLVIAQVALSLLLLIGSGLFIRSLNHASKIDPGFRADHLLLLSLDLTTQGYKPEKGQSFYQQALERLGYLKDVKSVSIAEVMDLGIAGQRRAVTIEGYRRESGEEMEIDFNRVGPSFFETMQIPLLRGRSFRHSDREGSLPVVIVNETFARRYWPGQDAIGKRLSTDETHWVQVIGIAKDAKYRTLGEDPRPYYYLPLYQDYRGSATIILRTEGSPSSISRDAQKELEAMDQALPVFDVKTGNDHLRLALLPAQFAAGLLGVFGALALTLAAIGIYGVMSYGVSQRTKEIGIRIAIGAQRKDVMRLVLKQAMQLTVIGILIGFVGAFSVTRFASAFLYGVSPQDPLTFMGIAAVLGTVAFVSCYVPANRAVRVDPAVALRYE